MRVTVIPVGAFWTVSKSLEKKIGVIEIQRKNQDHPDHRIDQIGQNTEKSPENLRRLAVTKALVKKAPTKTGLTNL